MKAVAAAFLVFAPPALASPCARVDRAVAEQAASRLKKGTVLEEICRACGDAKAKPLWIDHAVVAPTTDAKLFTVEVNGRALDLADVYLEEKGVWTNLAASLRCGAITGTKLKLSKSDLAPSD